MSHEGELSTHKKSAASTEGENQVATDENTIKSGSLADAIGQRRKIEDFTKWANLTADEARALLKRGGLSADAIASISQFLPAEEAAGYLRDAVKQSPNDPYLRMALAKTLAGLPNGGTEALTQLAAWNKQDSKNSLNQFMEAQVRFKQGDNEGALNALTRGSALSSASAYSIQAAHGQELMLAAAGMSSDAARYTAASNIGGQEYSDINNLSRSLLQYGNYYQSTGDLETAQQVYQAVQQMGVQLVESAAVANEQLAGYDTQLQALEALRQVYEILADAQNLQALESAYSGVLDGLSQLSEGHGPNQQYAYRDAPARDDESGQSDPPGRQPEHQRPIKPPAQVFFQAIWSTSTIDILSNSKVCSVMTFQPSCPNQVQVSSTQFRTKVYSTLAGYTILIILYTRGSADAQPRAVLF